MKDDWFYKGRMGVSNRCGCKTDCLSVVSREACPQRQRGKPRETSSGLERSQFMVRRTLKLVARLTGVLIGIGVLTAQPSQFSPQSESGFRNKVRIEYVVDARDAQSKMLSVRAQIYGLEPGLTTLTLWSPKESSPGAGNWIESLSVGPPGSGTKKILPKRNKFRVETDAVTPLEISYQIKVGAAVNLGRSSFLDENRGFLTSLDTLLVPENARASLNVSFLLPPRWKVGTLATPSSPDSYEVEGKKGAFFYLGEATGVSERINNIAVTLAVEAGWPRSSRDTMRETRNQITYLQNLVADWKPRTLFIVFLSPKVPLSAMEEGSFLRDTIFVISPQSQSEDVEDLGDVHLQLAEKLVTYFLSPSRHLTDIQQGLLTYLALKSCLKTGGMPETEFLERISLGLLDGPSPESRRTTLEPGPKPEQSQLRMRRALDFFAIDLALAYEGRQSNSMITALQELPPETSMTPGNWLKKILKGGGLAPLAEELSSDPNSNELAEVFKPFGLLMERIELPRLTFDLSETFQVSRLEPRAVGPVSSLQMGDRILAVNQDPLLEPTDLLKLRSSLRKDEDVILTVEREGSILKVKERLGGSSYCRLMTNGLADSDKQQKLERFLGSEVSN
jgi:M61 glycyl aminopeptidase